jgi:hypothetical protein
LNTARSATSRPCSTSLSDSTQSNAFALSSARGTCRSGAAPRVSRVSFSGCFAPRASPPRAAAWGSTPRPRPRAGPCAWHRSRRSRTPSRCSCRRTCAPPWRGGAGPATARSPTRHGSRPRVFLSRRRRSGPTFGG